MINETAKSFENTFPHELLLMEDKEIFDLISNTFESKVISSDPKWMIIESEWSHIDNDGDEFIRLQNRDLMSESFKIYFHIFKEKYSIIRGESSELMKFLNLAKTKFPPIKSGGTDDSSMIVEGRMFPRLVYALTPVPKGKEFSVVDGEYYSLNSMGCSSDIRFSSKTIAYFSNLLIGSTLSQMMKLKRNKK